MGDSREDCVLFDTCFYFYLETIITVMSTKEVDVINVMAVSIVGPSVLNGVKLCIAIVLKTARVSIVIKI